jgi:hypothetical protein
MKFFTPEYYQGEMTSRECKAVWEAYEHHLMTLQDVLPPHVLELARLYGVDDGLIVDYSLDAPGETQTLILRCGDGPTGYYNLVLTYSGAEMSDEDTATLARLAQMHRDGIHGDIAWHEVDITDDGRVEHRIIFHGNSWYKIPYQEIAVRCDALIWEKIPVTNRDVTRDNGTSGTR